MRYVVLAWVIYVTATSGTLIFEAYDPYFALFNFWSTEVAWSAIAILRATLALSVFAERPWCKYACPYGAHLVIVDGAQPLPGQSMLDSWGSNDPQGVKELDRYVQETGEGWRVVPMDPREFGVTDEDDIRWLEKMDTPHPYKTFQDPAQYDLARVESIPQTIIVCIGSQQPPPEPPAWTKGKRFRTVASGHAVNVIAPKALTDLLLECV